MQRYKVRHSEISTGRFTEVFDLKRQSVSRFHGHLEPMTAVAFVVESRRLRGEK